MAYLLILPVGLFLERDREKRPDSSVTQRVSTGKRLHPPGFPFLLNIG